LSAALAIDDSVGISHHLAGGVYAKETRIPAGHVLVQHKHSYDHLSVLASGTVEVEVEGVRTRYTGPACLTIKAEAHHGVRSLTDAVWFCIHASNVADDDALISAETSVTEMEAIAAGLAR
jgi:quercetin dioxygenase-like cupin family protein